MAIPVDRAALSNPGLPGLLDAPVRDERGLVDWRTVNRRQRKRASADRAAACATVVLHIEQATCSSFGMDGLPLTPEEFRTAMDRGRVARARRTRSAGRVRNHVAILRRIELLLRRGQPLSGADVIRWYTSIAGGLSAGSIGNATLGRIERIVSSVNSPRLRFRPAVQEIAALHVNLLTDPFAPGFNGILARLLLCYHLGRCGLPPVVFDPETDGRRVLSEVTLVPRLINLLLESYEVVTTD